MPNLLVIQHLETLYLGGNHVRVVCERVWRKVQECALKKGLTTGSRNWQVAKGGTRVKHARELKSHASCCTTRQNFQFGHTISSQFKLVTHSSHEAASNSWLVPVTRPSHQNTLFVRNLTLRITYTPYYKYPYTHEM